MGSPEVATVFGKIGRADTATDPAPLSMAETTVRLRPREEWPRTSHPRWYSSWPPALRRLLRPLWPEERALTTAELVEQLDRAARLPGWRSAWTAPVRARLDMISTGVRSPVGVRISAPTPERLQALGTSAASVLSRVQGTRSAVLESPEGEVWPTFAAEAAALARWGVDPREARATAELLISGGAIGRLGGPGGQIPARMVQDQGVRALPDQLREATVPGAAGERLQPVPLALLGHPEVHAVPAALRNEEHGLAAYLLLEIDPAADLTAFVHRADLAIAAARATGELGLGAGERLDWIGQYPLLVAGERRLLWIVPIVRCRCLRCSTCSFAA